MKSSDFDILLRVLCDSVVKSKQAQFDFDSISGFTGGVFVG